MGTAKRLPGEHVFCGGDGCSPHGDVAKFLLRKFREPVPEIGRHVFLEERPHDRDDGIDGRLLPRLLPHALGRLLDFLFHGRTDERRLFELVGIPMFSNSDIESGSILRTWRHHY